MEYDPIKQEMPVRPSLIDTMRQDMETKVDTWEDTSISPERAPAPTIGFSYDNTTDEPPVIQRIAEAPMHSSPYQDLPKLHARAVPALLAPRPSSTSVPPVQHTGRGRGRGKWRSQSSETPGVGTRSRTRQPESAATQAQASRAAWPEKPDKSLQITRMTRDLRLQDPPEDRFRDTQRTLPTFQIDEDQNVVRPPAAGIHIHHRDIYVIPPRAPVVAPWGRRLQ